MINSFTLSFAAVDVLSQGLGVDCRAFPFQFPAVGDYVEDRVRILRAVRDDLEQRGLADTDGLNPRVVDALRLMSRYQVAVAVLGRVDSRDLYARAAADGDRAVLAVLEGNGLAFSFVRPESLAGAVAGLLPAAMAGPGQSVTITGRAAPRPLTEDRQEESLFARQVRPVRSVSEMRRAAAADLLRRPKRGSGYVIVSGRDRHRTEIQAPGLNWIDTDAGRYLARADTGNGPTSSTFFPADHARLTHQLSDLIATVATACG